MITINFDQIWLKCSKNSQIEFARFSFYVRLFFINFSTVFVFQTGHRKQCEFWRCIKQTLMRCNFLKHTPKLIIFGAHNLHTFKHNTLINKLLLMQSYLFDWVLCPTFIRKLCYKLPSVVTFIFIQTFDQTFCLLYWTAPKLARLLDAASKIRVIFGVRFERRKVD